MSEWTIIITQRNNIFVDSRCNSSSCQPRTEPLRGQSTEHHINLWRLHRDMSFRVKCY